MRIKRSTNHTYLKLLDEVYSNDEEINIDFVNTLTNQLYQLSKPLPFTTPIFFILDYTIKSYLSISNTVQQVVHYDPCAFLEGGIDFLIDIYQPDDFNIYNESVFKINTEFLQSVPVSEHSDHVFSYNFRARTAKGEWVHLLQKCTYITSKKTGLPLYSLGTVYDISNYKQDTVMFHQIEKYKSGVNREILREQKVHNYFYPQKEDQLLTKREKEILLQMADGLSSKEISDRYFISEHTVVAHRKRMLKKTNTKNMAQLIAYAIRNKII